MVLLPNFHVREHGLRCKHVPHAKQKKYPEDGQQSAALFDVGIVPVVWSSNVDPILARPGNAGRERNGRCTDVQLGGQDSGDGGRGFNGGM